MSLTWNRSIEWSTENWRDRSACRDVDPMLFFPVTSSGTFTDQTEKAKRICVECDVRDECLEFALQANQEAGIWGGTSEEERRRLRRQWLAERRRSSLGASSPNS